LEIGQYRPADAKEEVDILVRYPLANRHLGQLNEVFISNGQQQIPISQLVTAGPVPKTSMVKRSQGQLRYWLRANVSPELSVADKINELQQAIGELTLPAGVSYEFRGNQERQQESADFLVNAFWIALFIMAIILVTQFNSFYQALLVLSAIVFSTAGVLLGLLVSQQPFGIVMSGVGVIALAGVVVNNNIVLIDTFNVLRRQGLPVIEAALRTGAERFRPVLLTTITTVLGLLPMVYQLNVDLLARQVSIGAPAAKWWTQLATTITGGLLFATLLTLILTPCLLVLGSRKSKAVKQ
jgi:multidrug efflux pump